jgi:hypothetical protein
MLGREELVDSINTNIKVINECFDNLLYIEEIEKLFKELEDVMFFYGFQEKEIKNILKKGAINNSDSYKLAELHGITNAFIFQLRYKIKGNIKPLNINIDTE